MADSNQPNDEVEQIITDCENREERLTDWERNFIDSVSKQFKEKGSLSPKQLEVLNKIWDKVTR
jgi:hypothetical protein